MLYEFNNALGDFVVINLPIEYKEKYSFLHNQESNHSLSFYSFPKQKERSLLNIINDTKRL